MSKITFLGHRTIFGLKHFRYKDTALVKITDWVVKGHVILTMLC